MKKLLGFFMRILRPPVVFILVLTPLSMGYLIYIFASHLETTVAGYISHGLSAYTLAVIIINIQVIASDVRDFINHSKPTNFVRSHVYSSKFGSQYMTDKAYRAKVALYMSLAVNVFYSATKLLSGIYYASFWHGADAVFYILLSSMQVLLLRQIRKDDRVGLTMDEEFRQYRLTGYFLLVLNAALIGIVFQIVRMDMGYQYPGLLIYIVAAYAFACLTAAIIDIISYRKLNSPVLSAVTAVRLAKAMVAIFALQPALLKSFADEDFLPFEQLLNSLTGGAVCILLFGMAFYMIWRGNANLKKAA